MSTPFDDLPLALPGVDVLLDDQSIEPFGSDHLGFRGQPGAVVRPRTTDDVAALMSLSAERGFAVVPRAAATNLCGSVVPTRDTVVVDMMAMNRIVSVDQESLRAVVQPGIINATLQAALAPQGLCWSPDPASRPISTVGGNISTNAGGPGCIKYGVTFHHVHALEVVLADGRIVEMRDDDAVDLLGVMIGSEGTLGVVTRAELRLRRLPTAAWTALVSFAHIEEATATVSEIIAERINAAALELLDRRGVEVIDAWHASGYPTEPEALLFAEVDGEPGEVDASAQRLLAVLRRADPNVRVAQTPPERAALLAGRLGFAVAMTAGGKRNFVNDITVPRQRIPEIVARVSEIASRHALDVPIVAHAGDGNIHPVILFDERDRDAAFAGAFEMTEAAMDLGGTITGEHGVGSDKISHMSRRFTPAEIASFRAIKRAFDPDSRLNPHVLFPPHVTGEPADAVLHELVVAALGGRRAEAVGAGSGDDTSVSIDEENVTVEAGAAASSEDVRKLLASRGLACAAFDEPPTDSTVEDGSPTITDQHRRIRDVVASWTLRERVRPALLCIEADLPHGRVRFGSAAVKDVAGLDAKRLLTGNRLATIARATFRAAPRD